MGEKKRHKIKGGGYNFKPKNVYLGLSLDAEPPRIKVHLSWSATS